MESDPLYQVTEDLRQSEEYGKYMEKIGWKVVRLGNINVFVKRLGPVAIAKIQRVKMPINFEMVDKMQQENRVMMCKVEPSFAHSATLSATEEQAFKSNGYRLSSWPLLGTKTLRVNLRLVEGEIFKSFKKDARYVLRRALSAKYEVLRDNWGGFYDIWKKSARRKSLWIPKEKEYESLIGAFGKNCLAVTIKDLAGAVILINKKTAFYYYAGSTTEGTKLNLPYLVVWEAMKEAKKKGCVVWDFEGIYDSRWPNKGWRGFSHFKKSFGGVEIEFPGSWEKWRWPF